MDEKKKKFLKISFFVICTVLMFVFVTYAIFAYAKAGDEQNKVSTGTLVLILDESASEGISLVNTIPVSDTEGLATTPYTFKVENTGTLKANFQVSLIDDKEKYEADSCNDKKMPWEKLKYALSKDGGTEEVKVLDASSNIFDTGVLAPGEKKTYTLKLWISSNASNEVMGTHFHGKIQVKAIQEGHTNYETGE